MITHIDFAVLYLGLSIICAYFTISSIRDKDSKFLIALFSIALLWNFFKFILNVLAIIGLALGLL